MEGPRGRRSPGSARGACEEEPALDGVGHGSVLAGRYRLDDRVRTRPDGSLWRAVDETLERRVLVSAYAVEHPFGGEIVDAARRAALVEDPRLQRVLAAGTERGTPYVVLEPAAALTGRWPGTEEAGLARAPRVAGRPVPPGDLVAGVPNDLDTLCSVMLGPHDDGPRSPGELAAQLAPWAPAAPLTDPRGLHI